MNDLISRKAVLNLISEKSSILDEEYGEICINKLMELPTIPQVVCDDDCEHCSWVECPLPQKAEESPCNTCTMDCDTTCEIYEEWCHDCKEYDTEKHCCHRYSSFIRESLKDNIDAVLEDIKEDILKEINNHSFFSSSQKGLAIAYKIIDKYISGKE